MPMIKDLLMISHLNPRLCVCVCVIHRKGKYPLDACLMPLIGDSIMIC